MRPADLARLAAGTLAACFALLGADQGWPASWLWLLAFAAVGFPLAALLANAPAVVEVARTAPWRGPRATVAGAAAAVVAVALFGWFAGDLWNALAGKSADGAYHHEVLRNLIWGVGAGVGLAFAMWRTWLAGRQTKVQEQGHITDRFTRAVDQLGHDALHVRLGGIHALWRIGEESDRDYITILEILCAYVRNPPDTGERPPEPEPAGKAAEDTDAAEEPPASATAPDVQAILDLLGYKRSAGQRARERDQGFQLPLFDADLAGANLIRADLSGAILSSAVLNGARLMGADLSNARLLDANLTGANLADANLSDAELSDANLSGAFLSKAVLTCARFVTANLSDAGLFAADLSDAGLFAADLSDASLSGANLVRADLRKARLDRANLPLADLSHANLADANLAGVNLSGADLADADLSGVDLSDAKLADADLSGVDLSDADLATARTLSQDQIDDAFYRPAIGAPTLRPGFRPPPDFH